MPSATVEQIELPAAARRLGTLPRVDYADAFLVRTEAGRDRTAEQWARVVLEGAPASFRVAAPGAWFALGLKHGSPRSGAHVLGWPIRDRGPAHVLLGAESRLGMPAELLVKLERGGVLFSTMIEQRNAIMRAVWAPIAGPHQRVVRRLLERAGRR